MLRIPSASTLLLATCFLCASAQSAELPSASPEDVGLDSDVMARIGQQIEALVEEGQTAGAVVVVARHGKVVYEESFGMQNIAENQPMTTDSIFRFFSMTKPITSTAAMLLVEDGRLQLDDPVSDHLPEFTDRKVFVREENNEPVIEAAAREVTIRDLLRHTSGLTYGFFGDSYVDRRYLQAGVLVSPADDLQAMVSRLAPLPLLYQPGTRFNYSVSTDVLGRVVEVVSGQTLDDFFRERILGPLDMRDTAFHVSEEERERFATNYSPAEGGGLSVSADPLTHQYLRPPRLLSGGGGLVSTARDYLRFCQMLLNEGELDGERILQPETVSQMTANQIPDSAMPIGVGPGDRRPGIGFGLGFSVAVEDIEASAQPAGEYGWGGAASTHFWISPRHDLAVVALQQRTPFTFQLEGLVKPIVYEAVIE